MTEYNIEEQLNINKLYVGTIDAAIYGGMIEELGFNDVRTIKIALLKEYEIEDENSHYVDLETGIIINKLNKGYIQKRNYFINTSKCFIPFSTFIQKYNIDYKDNFISRRKALEIFNAQLNKIFSYEKEKTLTIIKPDAMNSIEKIIDIFYKNDLKIVDYKVCKISEELVKEHYSHLLDKPFYPKLQEYMMSGEVAIMVLEGYNAVDKLREVMGPTDSKQADINTIRGMFGTDKTYNAIHGSDSVENAEIEIRRFFKQKQKEKDNLIQFPRF